MLKSDVVKHFGSQAAAARALGIQRAAVSKWPERVPRAWAAQIHFATRGKVPYNPADYSMPTSRSAVVRDARKGA